MTVPGQTPSVRFEILGPLRAWREDTELDLGPGKQRAVLAVLLLNANRPTPTARIVDAVWGDEPPENGVNVVQKYVAGLRRILEPGRSPRSPGQLLTLTEAGYTLVVPPGRLDAEVFTDHVTRARTAGRTADAAGHLRAALALWHGEPLAGLRGPYFDAARERLAEDRAAAVEERARIELDLGEHVRLVPELSRLVAEFPVREELRYLQILALYRCGRQAEALAAYQNAREFLAEEFGVEPGERLRQLHLAILRSDRTLAPYSEPPPAPAPATPIVHAPPPPFVPAAPAAMAVVPSVWRPPPVLRALAIAVPLLSFGSLSWAALAFFAARRRSWALGLASAGYFLLVGVFVFTMSDSGESPWDNVAMLALLLAMVGGAVHVAVLVTGTSARLRNAPPDLDTLRSLELRIRREQALTLLDHYPPIARELRIGRPDLSRVFNDGGLVDINGVPEHVLAALPGVTVPQAQQIVARRRVTGGFASVEDLITYGLLPVPVVRALSDVLIAVAHEAPATAPAEPTAGGLALPN
ncbi:winged helix-turn-helix domain-containing protein [Actinoallomurus sp. NBC_01490]|uniref:BTAD domain-containing putative transcriptional regulator n=1 Tax=Actinoallomurus sp. NBC_01490 TaxID=2903557 RepID=UPI002E30CA2B|nr:BTAD domain-containing putative transcriptional regulator [Actinoallomurus sp. NBC_01490]